MSGKAGHTGTGPHGNPFVEGISTALSWMTIVPIQGARTFDRVTGARAMAALPVSGLVLGLAALPLSLVESSLLSAVLAVVVWELGSRMMHIDGLADVGDALGSYASPDRAQEILGDRYTGALGMGSVVLVLLMQVAGIASGLPAYTLVFLPMLGRTCALIGCHRSFRPFSTTGFGSLIVGTVRSWWIIAWALVLLAGAWLSVGATWWHFGVALLVACLVSMLFARHCSKRFAGLNGDTTGALVEVSVAVGAVVLGLFA